MIQIFPSIVFGSTFLFFFGELILVLLKKKTMANGFRIAGIVSCLTGVAFIIFSARRLPLFGPFEAGSYIAFILALLTTVFAPKISGRPGNMAYLMIRPLAVVLVMALQFGHPLAINDDYYMYDNLWVILFFNLRLVSAAFFVHVMVLHLACLFERQDDSAVLLKTARYQALTGVFIYLCSEWSGSFWCLNWFGDSWQWSSGFFKSSLLFLLVMALFHLPVSVGRHRWIKVTLGSLPGTFALWMIFFH
jgi:hypothetical protein